MYHVTKFSPYFSFTVYCLYTKISSFMPVLSIRIVLDCCYLLIFYFEKFSTHVCRLPYAANVNRVVLKFRLGTYVFTYEGLCLEQDQDENFLAEIDLFSQTSFDQAICDQHIFHVNINRNLLQIALFFPVLVARNYFIFF